MTVTTLEDRQLSVDPNHYAPPPEPDSMGFVEQLTRALPAAFRTENTIGAATARFGTDQPLDVRVSRPDFDPFANIAGYEDYASAFVHADTPADVALVKSRIDAELADQKALSETGAGGVAATFAAGLLDPMLLLPIGGAAVVARDASLLERGLLTMKAGFTAATAQELALQSAQDTRSWGQSAENVAVTTLLSGVLGTTLGAIDGKLRTRIEAEAKADLGGVVAGGAPGFTEADLANPDKIETKLKSSFGVAEALGKIHTNPNLWVYSQVKSDVARSVWRRLFTNPLRMIGETAGETAPLDAENAINHWKAAFVRWQQEDTRLFTEYRNGEAGGRARVAAIRSRDTLRGGAPEGFLSRPDWKAELSRAMNSGDTHAVQQLQQSAKNMRALLDKVKEEYNALGGQLVDEAKGAASYFPHHYNRKRLVQEQEPFKQLVRNELYGATLRAQQEGGDTALAKMTDADRSQIAQQAYEHIMGLPEGLLGVGHAGAGSPLAERKLTVPFSELDKLGVLEHDAERTLRSYIRTMGSEIEIRRVLGGIDANGSDLAKEIKADFARLMEESPKDRQALAQQQQKYFDQLSWGIQSLLGTYKSTTMPLDGVIVRTLRGTRRATSLALGGQYALSSLSDAARITMVNGLRRTFGSVIRPLITDLHGLKLSAAETQRAGAAFDLWLDTQGRGLEDVMDEFGRHSRFERGLESMSEMTPLVSGLAAYNQGLEVVAGATAQSRIFEIADDLLRGKKIKAGDAEYMRHVGLSDADLRKIARAEWLHRDQLHISQTDQWSDPALTTRYHAAVRKAVFEMIPRPSTADKPRFMSDEWGKLLLHLKGFTFGATNRVLVANLQQRDAAVLAGSLQALALGMATYAIKRQLAGKELAAPDDYSTWIREGIDRGNLLGIVSDGYNIVDRITGWGGAPVSRYASRNVGGALLGPSVGQAQDFTEAITSGFSGTFTQGDLHRIRRLAPWQNHWALTRLYDQAEKGLANAFDIPEHR